MDAHGAAAAMGALDLDDMREIEASPLLCRGMPHTAQFAACAAQVG